MNKEMSSNKLFRLAGLVFVAVLLLLLGVTYFATRYAPGPRLGGDFTLQSAGGDVSLASLEGKVAVLYFGFTSCPDACPTALSRLSRILKKLPDDQRSRIVPVFVSVDPDRDSPEKVSDYARFYYPDAIGLTGDKQTIDRVTKQYGAFYSIEKDDSSAQDYNVQHSPYFFLVDSSGDFAGVASASMNDKELTEKLLALL